MASITLTASGSWSGSPRTVTATISTGSGDTVDWSISSSPSSGTRPFTKIQLVIGGQTVVATAYPSSFPSSQAGDGWATYGGSRSGSVTISGGGSVACSLGVGIGHNNYTDATDSGTLTRYTKYTVNSWSASLAASIVYLKSTITANVTQGSSSISYMENEIGVSNDNIVKQTTFHTGGNYNGTSTLTATGDEIRNTVGLGQSLYSNLEISDGSSSDEFYSSGRFSAPTNLYSNPSISGTPSVTKVTASNISISVPSVSNWIRSEGQAFYCHALTEVNSSGSGIAVRYAKWGQSSQSLGTLSLAIASSKSASMQTDPGSETVSAGTGYNYNLARGSSYYFVGEAITKYLGVRRSTYSSKVQVYIPYLPTLTKNSFTYTWVNTGGRIYRRLISGNITLSNPNSENIGNRYMSMNSTKVAISSISGSTWTPNTSNSNLQQVYNNSAISGTAYAWMYYATNKYSESIIDPVSVSDSWSVAAGQIKCALGTVSIDSYGKLKTGNCSFNMPTTDTSQLPIGTMTATLQVSKNSNFNSITHQQTKTVSKYGTTNNMFDDIELLGSDLGTNYIRIKWNLSSSGNYYNTSDVYSPVKSIEFTGIIPTVTGFNAWVDATSKKIKVNVTEEGGIPIPKIYIDVYRTSGGANYATFEVQNGVDYELPYTEPGTIWYLRGRAVNAIGTAYGLDGEGNTKEIVLQLPYTTTENYDEVAQPKITAGKVQLDTKCTIGFTWTNLVTDLYKTTYNIEMVTNNQPIVPSNHNNKSTGYNYTFTGRKDLEKVAFLLNVVCTNSFGDTVIAYQILSNEITLDAIDLDAINFTMHTNTTYHSIEFVLDSINKNNNKLVNMLIELTDKESGALIGREFIGDEVPTTSSQDLNPIQSKLFESLQDDYPYHILVSMLGVNPLDLSKQHTTTMEFDVTTNEFNVYPIKNEVEVITNQVDGKPTINSDIQLSWDTPDAGDAEVIDYVVRYRKTGSELWTEQYVTIRQFEIQHGMLGLQNNDVVYIEVGAHYRNYFNNDVIKWKTLPSVVLAATNYIYYRCTNPDVEKSQKLIYRNTENTPTEDLVLSLYLDE